MTSHVKLLIGTTKGVFLLASDQARADWALSGPYCDGWPINHVVGDPASGDLWAAGGSGWYGNGVWHGTSDGRNWTLSRFADGEREAWISANPEDAAEYGLAPQRPGPHSGDVAQVWSLALAGTTLYAGTMPANLYASHDRGRSWALLAGLATHETRQSWEPGGAGLILHTIVSDPADPARLWVAISMAGVLASEDSGKTWEQRIALEGADGKPGARAEIFACVHNMVRAPDTGDAGDLLYQQNHHGVFRSDDGARNWRSINSGLPSDFGFPIAVHPRDAQTIWVVPLNGDSIGRYPPDAAAAVWRSRDGGKSWHDLRCGLPGARCYFTVLRQAMAVDRAEPAGVYFGTNSGSIFASANEGDTWREIARHLPTVLSVEVLHCD